MVKICLCNFTIVFNFLKGVNEGYQKFEVREFKYGSVVITQIFLLNYFLFKILVNLSKKVKFLSEKQKDMSDDGNDICEILAEVA